MGSIIQKAKDIKTVATLVLGRKAEGKTTHVIQDVQKQGFKNPLWVVFNNADTLREAAPEWDVAVVADWDGFEELRQFVFSMDEMPYDCIVFDGLSTAANFYMNTTQYRLQDYGVMGRELMGMIGLFREKFDSMYFTLDIVPNEAGDEIAAVNRDLAIKVFPYCGRVHYCYAEPDEDKNPIYKVQTVGVKALRFRPN